jgi:DNA-binding transcriptional LysR family regulator
VLTHAQVELLLDGTLELGLLRPPVTERNLSVEVLRREPLVSFVAAGLGVSLVPASVRHMTVEGAVYRPLARDAPTVELAAAWRHDDATPVLQRALGVLRDRLG